METPFKDGVTVAKEIELEDRTENIGAQMVKEVASKTSEIAGRRHDHGDRARCCHLPRRQSLRRDRLQPDSSQEWHEKAVVRCAEEIKRLSKPIKGDAIAQVGTVSANGDSRVGELIAEAMSKVGRDGVITVEESQSLDTTLEVVEGVRFDRGYLSPHFVTDTERMEAVLEDALVLILGFSVRFIFSYRSTRRNQRDRVINVIEQNS